MHVIIINEQRKTIKKNNKSTRHKTKNENTSNINYLFNVIEHMK